MNTTARDQLNDIIDWHATKNEFHPYIGVYQIIAMLEYLAGEKHGVEATTTTTPSEPTS